MLVLAKVFVNPDFSTSPVQVVLSSFLYQWAGTPAGLVPGKVARPPNSQPEAANIRYNAGRLERNAKGEAEGACASF